MDSEVTNVLTNFEVLLRSHCTVTSGYMAEGKTSAIVKV